MRPIVARNPATGELIREVPFMTNDEILAKVKKAADAFKVYSKTDLATRQERFRKASEVINKNADKYATIVTQESGKTFAQSKMEVLESATMADLYAQSLPNFIKTEPVKSLGIMTEIHYAPLGVIYQLLPFNYPFAQSIHSALPCLAVGNTIIHRNSDSTPGVGAILEEIFVEAGWNNGEFLNVYSSADQLDLILSQKAIRGVEFTGGTRSGAKIAETAGRYLKKAVLELGGSDPFVVLHDADLELASTQAVEGRMFTCGQVCCSPKRMIVDEKVYEKFKALCVEKLKALSFGDPRNPDTVIGPQARKDLQEATKRQFDESIKQGGKLVFEKEAPSDPALANGYFSQPKIVEVSSRDNILMREEVFGPILCLFKVKNEEEALEVANDTDYGLGGSVHSTDLRRAMAFAEKIEAGFVSINAWPTPEHLLPFGGVKNSGFGRTGALACKEFANVKPIWIQ